MNNKRLQILSKLVEECLNSNIIKTNLLFVSLLGSTQTDEAIEGYSDLDILFILKSNESGAVDISTLTLLKKIAEEISVDNKIEISFLTHTVFDFEEYVDFEYLIHYSWGEVVSGSKEAYSKLFSQIIEKKLSEKERKNLMYYDLIHARFNLIRRYVSWNKYNKDSYTEVILKLFIDTVIEMCDWALIYRGIFKRNKKEIIEEFTKEFDLGKNKNVPSQAYAIRANWSSYKFKEGELLDFVDEAVLFVQELVRIIYHEHVRS